jgi:hypothetical protein
LYCRARSFQDRRVGARPRLLLLLDGQGSLQHLHGVLFSAEIVVGTGQTHELRGDEERVGTELLLLDPRRPLEERDRLGRTSELREDLA